MPDAAEQHRLRVARQDDIALLRQMWPSIFEKPTLADRFAAAVATGEVIVIDGGGVCQGFAWIQPHGFFGHAFLNLLAVSESRRRRGLGSALVAAAEQCAATDRVFSSTNASNAPMHRLFARRGWTRCGEIDALDPSDPEIVYVFRVPGDLGARLARDEGT